MEAFMHTADKEFHFSHISLAQTSSSSGLLWTEGGDPTVSWSSGGQTSHLLPSK